MEQSVRDGQQLPSFYTLAFGFTVIAYQAMPQVFPARPAVDSQNQQNASQAQVESAQNPVDAELECFRACFSPMGTANALRRRNENLEMMKFEMSDEEPDEVYNRRKKKAESLATQQEQQIQIVQRIRSESQSKFTAMIEFISVFSGVRGKIRDYRPDYYSNKTFCALKNSDEQQLGLATKVVRRMYENVFRFPSLAVSRSLSNSEVSDANEERMIEFLIIPRFLISREKVIRLIKDQVLQKNFEFLIVNECLGHYNNQANKKLPEEHQMKLVRELLGKRLGRERFKKICSINHGNRFLKSHGKAYYDLYNRSLQYLRHLQNSLKRGKKYEAIVKELQKIPAETEETMGNSSNTQNQSSSSGIYSFRSLGECLNKLQNSSHSENQAKEHPSAIEKTQPLVMSKFRAKKMVSMPNGPNQSDIESTERRAFGVKKMKTMNQAKTTQNIILISPDKNNEI